MAYNEGYTTAEITTSQFVLGIIEYYLLICSKKKKKHSVTSVKAKYISTNAGTSLGMTSILLFSRKIHSCFHWDCIVDAKRVMGCYSKCS
jgi:hypothetical protein